MRTKFNFIKESLISILMWGFLFFCAGSVFGTLGILVLDLVTWIRELF